jgi:glycosyltransferase involved in cell wall biosynthesis
VPDKQPELFIEALAKLQNRIDKKIELTMVGNGNRVPELKALCQSLNLNVDFVGYKTKPQIAEILYKSDFFLHASKVETFGVVVVEALMTGTPVICSAVGGLPELIDDSNGVLCENTVDDWEEAVTKSIRKLFVSRFISDNIVDNYSYNRIGGVINRIYRSINKKDHIYFDS